MTNTVVHTIEEVLKDLQQHNPQFCFARNRQGNAIAYKVSGDSEWEPCASQLIGKGEWAGVRGNLMANGEPVWKQEDWVEEEGPQEIEANHATA